jgi:hypothetical protein
MNINIPSRAEIKRIIKREIEGQTLFMLRELARFRLMLNEYDFLIKNSFRKS